MLAAIAERVAEVEGKARGLADEPLSWPAVGELGRLLSWLDNACGREAD